MADSVVALTGRAWTNPFVRYGLVIVLAVAALLAFFPGIAHRLFSADEFMPHATCYLRNPKVILLHVTSDLLIGTAYVCISGTLAYLVHKASKDIPFHWMFLAFGLFIVTCGFTHFMEVWTVWQAVYWLAGYVKLLCAVASVATAVALFPLVPKIFALLREVRVSEQRERELKRANDELQAFAYSVSHDLRAPLRAVQGMALALSEDYGAQMDPGAKVYLERIVGAAARMDTLVRDLLEYSRVARAEAELQPVALKAVWHEAETLVRSDVEQSGAELRVEIGNEQVLANHRLLIQVLANLLGNALKFVAPGVKPVVHVSTQQNGKMVRLTVADNGIGIPAEYQHKVFKMFERLHGVTEYPGTGIGLAIVQKAMTQMQGSVGLESTPGQGSRFWIELRSVNSRELAGQKLQSAAA